MSTVNIIIPPYSSVPGDERMPLGAAYLSSVLKKRKIAVNCIDTRFEKANFDCEFMGVTVFTSTFAYVKELVRAAKEKGIKVIAGGPHAKADPMSLIRIGVDAVVVGEGEEMVPDLIDSFKEGVHYAEPIEDLDSIPFPDMELLNKYPYRENTAWLLTSRGCPNQCSYCQKFFGNKVRLRSVENIFCEVERYGGRMIEIVDDCFTINRRRVFEFCERLPKLDYCLLALSNGTIAKTLTEELVETLAGARLTNAMIGIESIDPTIIRLANRNIYPEDCEKVITWCKKNHIDVGVFMIIGLPGSSYESDMRGVEWVNQQKVWANYGTAIPFRNTLLWDWVQENGTWLTDPYDYTDYPPKFEMEHYKREDIENVFKYALEVSCRFAFRPPQGVGG